MSLVLAEVEREALALSAEERAKLAEKLWDSLGYSEPAPLNEKWLRELEKRRKDFEEGEAKAIPGEDVSRKAWEIAKARHP